MAVLLEVPSFFFLMHSDASPREIFSREHEENCTDVYILFFPSASFFVVSFGYSN